VKEMGQILFDEKIEEQEEIDKQGK